MEFVPYAGPWITAREVELVADAAANAWYERAGEFQLRFERAFAETVKRRFAVTVPHCTAAIHLALLALGVGPGDEVIVPDVTWIATAAPVTYVGATPVFADVNAIDWCLSPESFEACITAHTKAVIPVESVRQHAGLRSHRRHCQGTRRRRHRGRGTGDRVNAGRSPGRQLRRYERV